MEQVALKPSTRGTERRRDVAAIAVAFATYLLLCIPLRHWVVDDAAISMAYAANWTAGHGLVAQPAVAPVEGYSNFLWVVVLAGLNLLGLMTPVGIKAVAAALVLLSLASLNSTSKLLIPKYWHLRAIVLLFVATSSSIVTWTTSGLENPLTLLLASELLRIVASAGYRGASTRMAVYAGTIAAAAAMTRPDGIALVAFPPLALAMFNRRDSCLLLPYFGTTAALFGVFLAFRLATFGEWVPNTFHAKQASSFDIVQSMEVSFDLLRAPFLTTLVVPILLVLAILQTRKGKERALVAPLCLMTVTGAAFVLLPMDWMPDRRFATAFLPAVFLLAGVVVSQLVHRRFRDATLALLIALAMGGSAYRLEAHYRAPTVPMALVDEQSEIHDERARLMKLRSASVLMPDIGAALLSSHLRVYDLAGLIDPVIARSLHSDKARLHNYIFEELRPTFIRTHEFWAEFVALDEDPRFRRDYVPITEGPDEFLAKRGLRLRSGEYVRRENLIATKDPFMLDKLRSVTVARSAELHER